MRQTAPITDGPPDWDGLSRIGVRCCNLMTDEQDLRETVQRIGVHPGIAATPGQFQRFDQDGLPFSGGARERRPAAKVGQCANQAGAVLGLAKEVHTVPVSIGTLPYWTEVGSTPAGR